MTLKLSINPKPNPKLATQFPEDPYADTTVVLQLSTLRLSLAYLGIDSQRFADLPQTTTEIDLRHLPQQPTLAVLGALYGGELICSSAAEFDGVYGVIEYLQIGEYRRGIEPGVRQWLEKRDGAPGSLEWVEVCFKHGLLRQWIADWLGQQHLRILESTKNYLQLGKLSDDSLNYILLEYLKREPTKTAVVNTILENYFNRRGHSPSQYFQPEELLPLKNAWEKHHHKFRGLRPEKMISIQNLVATTVTSPRNRDYEPRTALRVKRGTGSHLISGSVNIASDLFMNERIPEGKMLDLRLSLLATELQTKNRKVRELREELEELERQKERKMGEEHLLNEESQFDVGLLKSRMKSRRQKERPSQPESISEYALDVPNKPTTEQEKMRVLVRGIPTRRP